jgi:hypothetical protein
MKRKKMTWRKKETGLACWKERENEKKEIMED